MLWWAGMLPWAWEPGERAADPEWPTRWSRGEAAPGVTTPTANLHSLLRVWLWEGGDMVVHTPPPSPRHPLSQGVPK